MRLTEPQGSLFAAGDRSLTLNALQLLVQLTHKVLHLLSVLVDPGVVQLHRHHIHHVDAEILTRNPRVQGVISPRKTICR